MSQRYRYVKQWIAVRNAVAAGVAAAALAAGAPASATPQCTVFKGAGPVADYAVDIDGDLEGIGIQIIGYIPGEVDRWEVGHSISHLGAGPELPELTYWKVFSTSQLIEKGIKLFELGLHDSIFPGKDAQKFFDGLDNSLFNHKITLHIGEQQFSHEELGDRSLPTNRNRIAADLSPARIAIDKKIIEAMKQADSFYMVATNPKTDEQLKSREFTLQGFAEAIAWAENAYQAQTEKLRQGRCKALLKF